MTCTCTCTCIMCICTCTCTVHGYSLVYVLLQQWFGGNNNLLNLASAVWTIILKHCVLLIINNSDL